MTELLQQKSPLHQAMEELPAKCRMALIMARKGKSYEEIGAELNVEANTAELLVERAMEFLLQEMTKVN
jgi:RNA polymerase sigma factor (sigma-70 family)